MRRCVLPTGSIAVRWRQACARFYATSVLGPEGKVKRPKGRPPKTKIEDPLELGIDRVISTVVGEATAALPVSIGNLKPFDDPISTATATELKKAAKRPRGRPRKVRDDQMGSTEGDIKGGTDGVASSSVAEPAGASSTLMGSLKPISTSDDQKPSPQPRGQPPKKQKEGNMDSVVADLKNEHDRTTTSPFQTSTSSPNLSSKSKPSTIDSTYPSIAPLHRPLPISPLMDPAFLAARAKHKVRKGPPTKGAPGSLRARLAKNPYALALATPIRACQVTGALLPTFFLQDFNMMAHPEMGEPRYVPVSLTKHDEGKARVTKSKKQKDSEEGSDVATSEFSGEQDLKAEELKESRDEGKKIGYNAYIISSLPTMDQMKQNNFHPTKLTPQRLRRIPSAAKTAGNAGWRKDMGSFLLKLWRRRISEDLIHVKGLKNGYMVNCTDWEDAKSKSQVGAYLWVGDSDEGAPRQWATLDVPRGHAVLAETRKVPVFNLRALLGNEALHPLISGENGTKTVLGGNVVVLKDKRVTLELRMKLWKFQGFLAIQEEKEVVYDDDSEDWDDQVDNEDEDDEGDWGEEVQDDLPSRNDWTIRPSAKGRPREVERPRQTNQPRQNAPPSTGAQGFTIRREEFQVHKKGREHLYPPYPPQVQYTQSREGDK